MNLREVTGSADDFGARGAIHFLRQIADLLVAQDAAVRAQNIFRNAGLVVAEAGRPGNEKVLGLIERDGHGIGNFAAVAPEISSAGHRNRARNFEVERFVPEGQLLRHVLVDAAAGIVGEHAPVDEAVRVERAFRIEGRPVNILRIDVGGELGGSRPLRFRERSVAIHPHVDGGDASHALGLA